VTEPGLQAGSEEVVSSIARRALSLIADAGHLALPEPAPPAGGQAAHNTAAATAQQPSAGPPASQLFQPELQRVGCSATDARQSTGSRSMRSGSNFDSSAAAGGPSCATGSCEDASRRSTANEARAPGRQTGRGAVSRQPTAAAEPAPASGTSSGLGPSPKAAALLKRLKAFMEEHILPAGAFQLNQANDDLKHSRRIMLPLPCFSPAERSGF
jgi:hypothetical protein